MRLPVGYFVATWMLLLLIGAGVIRAGVTERLSIADSNTQGSDDSRFPSISEDGHIIAFVSRATNLVANDTNAQADIFIRDRHTMQTLRVNLSSSGDQAIGYSSEAAISGDGLHVAFSSEAANLIDNDQNGLSDIFVRDLASAQTVRVSLGMLAAEANGFSAIPTLSHDGMIVAFESVATNLVDGDTNSKKDVFVYNRASGVMQRVSVASNGSQSNGVSDSAVVSADGRYVVFRSDATNLVPDDTNATSDVFVHDRLNAITQRVSVDSQGAQANGDSRYAWISGDGRYVSFTSLASTLVSGDTNSVTDVFVRDRTSGSTIRVSVGQAGQQANNFSFRSVISNNGCVVAFESQASNLVDNDTNDKSDIFLRDVCGSITKRASRTATGQQGNDQSFNPAISSDGKVIAFESYSTNLVSSDTNLKVDTFVRDARPAADFDDDGDVDSTDRSYLTTCALGANVPQTSPLCAAARLDDDSDVDQDDFGVFQRCYTGLGVINPDCENR